MIVLVVSTGRAGSSAVARVLHTKMGISMGTRFRPPDEENPKGFYEDLDFKDLNEYVLTGRITFPEFETRIRKLAGLRSGDWGLKDPRLSHLWGIYLSIIPDARIIITERNPQRVVESCMKQYGWNKANAERFVYGRVADIKFLRNYGCPVISFDEKLSDENIENFLKENLYA